MAADGGVLDSVRSKKSILEVASTSHSLMKSGWRCASTADLDLCFARCLDHTVPAFVKIVEKLLITTRYFSL